MPFVLAVDQVSARQGKKVTKTDVVISFTGSASKNNSNVDITFGIMPYPQVSFEGEPTLTMSCVFNKADESFSQDAKITHTSAPDATLNKGYITIHGQSGSSSDITSTSFTLE